MLIPDQRILEHLVAERTYTDEKGCWVWTGSTSHNGYAQHSVRKGRRTYSVRMHVAMYLTFIGDMEKEELHHKCENKLCINPDHLEDVTKETNTRYARGWTLNKDGTWNCKRGHHMFGYNLGKQSSGHARCKACQALAVERFRG